MMPVPGSRSPAAQRRAFWAAYGLAGEEERAALMAAYHERQDAEWRERKAVVRSDEGRMDACEMRSEAVRGLTEAECAKRRVCYGCGSALPKGSRRWCSSKCGDGWWSNHGWTSARSVTLVRDEHRCVRCGSGSTVTCGLCGLSWPCGDERHRVQTWRRLTVALEVNHREPRIGQGYHNGCHNHQENLETLCHPCHVAETTAQFRERREIKIRARIVELGFDPDLRPATAELLSLWDQSA